MSSEVIKRRDESLKVFHLRTYFLRDMQQLYRIGGVHWLIIRHIGRKVIAHNTINVLCYVHTQHLSYFQITYFLLSCSPSHLLLRRLWFRVATKCTFLTVLILKGPSTFFCGLEVSIKFLICTTHRILVIFHEIEVVLSKEFTTFFQGQA